MPPTNLPGGGFNMRFRIIGHVFILLCIAASAGVTLLNLSSAADHNDPNAVNSIFSDIDVSAADLYDIFGWPADDTTGGEKVVIALTFASVPKTGVFDSDMLYRILIAPTSRDAPQLKDDAGLEVVLKYFEAIKNKYVNLKPAEVRVTVDKDGRAKINFIGFPAGAFVKVIDTNKVTTIDAPDGSSLKAYIGGRDDAFFNDLPGFFRSINYVPQFYRVPHTMTETRELPIPKTVIELEGNKLFNFDTANPKHGQGVKLDLPSGPLTWSGNRYFKDKNGNSRFVYSGKDAQAGMNINAIILEIPIAFLTKSPEVDRIVNTWGESWVLKAANKIETIPDDRAPVKGPFLLQYPWLVGGVAIVLGALLLLWGFKRWSAQLAGSWIHFSVGVLLVFLGAGYGIIVGKFAAQKPELARPEYQLDDELKRYKLVDTDGQAFADAGLSERDDDRQLGAFNFWLAPHFVTRLAHLGWGFGPSITALGLKTSFDHDNSPVSVHKTYESPVEAFPRVKKVVLQQLNMPDSSWNKKGLNIPLRRAIEIFVPNVNAIDMDTTGTWPFGRRPEDQVATRFLALFLDMKAEINGKPYNLETLGDQSLWDHAPIEPKTPPNPLKNDKEFLKQFPYLAEPW
jgi:Domain of unknown function (DUF4331)